MHLLPPCKFYQWLPFLLLKVSGEEYNKDCVSIMYNGLENCNETWAHDKWFALPMQKWQQKQNLTLNSSSVKLTRPTPHQGSILKSTGCDGKSSLAIDLFSFHIIFWMNVKGFRIKILVFECASEIVMTLSSSNYWDKTDHEIWLDSDLSSRGPSFQLRFQESFRLLTKCWFYICWIAYDPVGAFLEYLRVQDELVT